MVVPLARGDVLELGAGGGINAQFYDAAKVKSLRGIDPSPALLDRARTAWDQAGSIEAEIVAGVAEDLPFAAASFDTVVTTFTLCSVNDHAKALSEARRVLRPGGTLLFLEHGASPDAGPAKWQRRIEPVWKRMMGNCHITRPVADAIAGAGFGVTDRNGRYMDKTPRFVGWVEWGSAVPQ